VSLHGGYDLGGYVRVVMSEHPGDWDKVLQKLKQNVKLEYNF